MLFNQEVKKTYEHRFSFMESLNSRESKEEDEEKEKEGGLRESRSLLIIANNHSDHSSLLHSPVEESGRSSL